MASARVVKEKNGTYTVRVKVKRPPDEAHPTEWWGTDTKRGFQRKGDAEDYRTTELAKIKGNTYTRPSKITPPQLRDRWIKALPANHEPATVASYERWSARFADRFAQREVSTLQVDDIEGWVAELRDAGLSDTSAGYALSVVKIMLKQAAVWGIVARNVASLTKRPKPDTKERRVWDLTQIKAFGAHVEGDSDAAAIRLLLFCGIRLGELLGLRLEDVDLSAPEIRIRQTRVTVKGQVLTGRPKTAKSRRTIGLDARTADVLRRHLETRELEKMVAGDAWVESGLVFTDQLGRGIRPGTFRRRFAKLVASSGLPVISVHDCRHSHATAALASGQPIKVVSERLGHSNIGITLNTYGHVLPGQDAALATAVAALIDDED
jgi:integrase